MSTPLHRTDDADRALSRPRHKPRRRVRDPLAILVTLTLPMTVVSGCRAATTLPSTRPTATASPRPATADAKPTSGQNMCAPRLPWDTVRQQIALGMRLTVAQVRAQILRGQPIQDVATARHITLGRLHTIEQHALQVGNERWIKLGCNTRQEGDAYMRIYRRMTRAQLNQEVTTLFVGS